MRLLLAMAAVLGALFVLNGCANPPDFQREMGRKMGRIDPAERTMAVPVGGNYWLMSKLKDALVSDGWKITMDVGQDISGQVGPGDYTIGRLSWRPLYF